MVLQQFDTQICKSTDAFQIQNEMESHHDRQTHMHTDGQKRKKNR